MPLFDDLYAGQIADEMWRQTKEKMEAPVLLPCPFCGGDPLPRPERVLRDGHEADEEDPDAFAYFIRCRCCAAEGGWAKTEFGARRQWNTRAQE
jgi:hypothetical protein